MPALEALTRDGGPGSTGDDDGRVTEVLRQALGILGVEARASQAAVGVDERAVPLRVL